MAAIDGVASRLTCQGLLRTAARSRARPRLLARTTRWISSEEQARPGQLSPLRPEDVRPRDQARLKALGKPFRIIDQRSIVACNEPVKLVGSEIECVCSWNEASGPRHAIHVPGDASRPRRTSLSLSDPATRASLAPAQANRFWGHCNMARSPRHRYWDDALAALCATEPELKLDNVDVMIPEHVMLYLLTIAQNGEAPFFGKPMLQRLKSTRFNMLLIGNTLVIKTCSTQGLPDNWRLPGDMPDDWEFYKVATESVPAVEDSSIHYQLLRYNIGPLSCLIKVTVHGTVQEMPAPTCPPEAEPVRSLHGIDVIKAGHGVHPASSFYANVRSTFARGYSPDSDARRLRQLAPRLLLSGQTRLGIADVVPMDRIEELGGLTVLEMAEVVRHYESMNQEGLRRLAGLLAALRDVVRARGAPCVGAFFPPATSTTAERNYAIQVYGASPDDPPVLLDWHKEHFWSQNQRHEKTDWTLRKVPTGMKQTRPRMNTTKEQAPPQGNVNDDHVHTPKGFLRKWAPWLGF